VTIAYVGVGSNLEDPVRQVRAALVELDRLPQTRVVKQSSLYRSAPLGHSAQPDFINAVAQLETALPAERLLAALQQIEARHGRKRSFPDAPRTLDLDVLLFGEKEFASPGLRIPHPRMHERAFVLQPLLEVSPQVTIPHRGSARTCLEACSEQKIEKIDG
jgi:2-amino-4-hydroxy-6-hydroxymethyldihydropteridine diphosphokinase